MASKQVTLYHWRLNSDASKCQRENKEDAMQCLLKDGHVSVSDEWRRFQCLPYEITTTTDECPDAEYEPRRPVYAGDKGHTESKTLGWLNPSEHPDGILAKPCPVCGYKYGTAWKCEPVPDNALEFIRDYPSTGPACPTCWLRAH